MEGFNFVIGACAISPWLAEEHLPTVVACFTRFLT